MGHPAAPGLRHRRDPHVRRCYPRCARSAWSRRCRSAWSSCSTASWTAAIPLPCPSSWVVRDNKWRATRYGLDAIVITDEVAPPLPLRDELFELLAELEPVASRLGCQDELSVVSDVLEHGASYERQRAVYAQTGI